MDRVSNTHNDKVRPGRDSRRASERTTDASVPAQTSEATRTPDKSSSRRKTVNRSITADAVNYDALPGLSGRWNPTPSPPPGMAESSRQKFMGLTRPLSARSRSDNDARPGSGHRRQRTRTMEEVQRFTPLIGPRDNSIRPKARARQEELAETPSPIGYPSTIPYTFQEPEMSWQQPGRRPMPLPVRTRSRQRSVTQGEEVKIPRAKRVRHLMNVTQGRMSGDTYYTWTGSEKWHTAYCTINPMTGSLLREVSSSSHSSDVIVSNLRGCRARCFRDDSELLTLELATRDAPLSLQLRCRIESELWKWQAAFLCWQSVQSGRVIGQPTDSSTLVPLSPEVEPSLSASERASRSGHRPSIQKVGKLVYWCDDPLLLSPKRKPRDEPTDPKWMDVSCMIKNNGDFVIAAEDSKIVATVSMSSMSRSAIQRLHTSVFDREHCIVIVPQHSRLPPDARRLRPIVLACPSRELMEAWFMLLRAFAVVELYTPSSRPSVDILRSRETLPGLELDPTSSHFRVERFFRISVGHFEDKRTSSSTHDPGQASVANQKHDLQYHVEITNEGMTRAKTKLKPSMAEILFYEDFEVPSFPPTACFVGFRLIQSRRPAESLTGYDRQEVLIGEATVHLMDLCKYQPSNRNIVLEDENGSIMGLLGIKAFTEQHVILADSEYGNMLSDLLHRFSNCLTIEIGDRCSTELTKLSRILLNIFQVSRTTSDWLMSLAEEEIDGIRKEAPAQRERQNLRNRLNSNDSRESLHAFNLIADRSNFVRDVRGNAQSEANLLFRGNTLLSKALDYHMQRLGNAYLEKTLGRILRTVVEDEPDLEVDPTRASATASLQYNSVRLRTTAEQVWENIRDSVGDCPIEIRAILRHVKACAEDRFGDILRNAAYSAVSGFIFLRFFCPAILNPALFNLVAENLNARSQRNCTLIAKCIQGLANQTNFASKEPYMEPMNNFVIERRQEFRTFVDSLCSVPHGASRVAVPPAQAAAHSIFTRLPPLAQEGIPSLPYLIDSSRCFAALAKLWVDKKATPTAASNNDLQLFHHECLRINRLAQDCLAQAERSRLEGVDLSLERAAIAKRMEEDPSEFWDEDTVGAVVEVRNEATIEFAAETRQHRRGFGSTVRAWTSSPSRATDDEGRTRSFKGPLRLSSRSRSRPGSRQPSEREESDESSDEEEEARGHEKTRKLAKERPGASDKGKRRFWHRRESER